MTVRLDGKVAIVSGATAGVGLGISEILAERGAHVVGMGRRPDYGERAEKAIRDNGGSFTFVQGDVTSVADCHRTVDTAAQTHGRIDVLINNAAQLLPMKTVEDTTDEDWRAVIGPTLDGVFYLSRAVLPTMQAQKDGVIISIASTNALHATVRNGPYNVAKAGVTHLMKTIAVENLNKGVRANSAILGGVVTEMSMEGFVDVGRHMRPDGWTPDPEAGLGVIAPMMMEPREIGRSIAVLCSDDSREINGATIAIDRGFSSGFAASTVLQLAASQLMPTIEKSWP